jgi:hypothetical protein
MYNLHFYNENKLFFSLGPWIFFNTEMILVNLGLYCQILKVLFQETNRQMASVAATCSEWRKEKISQWHLKIYQATRRKLEEKFCQLSPLTQVNIVTMMQFDLG